MRNDPKYVHIRVGRIDTSRIIRSTSMAMSTYAASYRKNNASNALNNTYIRVFYYVL